MASALRKSNIQGDIWPGLPKRFQTFLFFHIRKPDVFKQRLKSFVPEITTSARATEMKERISKEKALSRAENRPAKLQPLPGVNMALSSTGLAALGKFTFKENEVKKDRNMYQVFKKQQLRGGLFGKGMYDDLVGEGWDDPRDLREMYKPLGGERPIDGVIMVTASLKPDMVEKVQRVREHFLKEPSTDPDNYILDKDPAVDFCLVREGKTRPEKGKEHFGFEDGISQPQIEGLDPIPTDKEPKAAPPGMILCGYEGDDMRQPDWARDGSFLVFRDLQQLVPEFHKFMGENSHNAPFTKDSPEPEEKLAAYLMGRWKDDPGLCKSNNFDYKPVEKHEKCPFAAHTRKMRPRGDLNNDHAVIIRRGIPYGDEVTPEEKAAMKSDPDNERGLLFACYQSDIRNGFNFLTTRWASNHYFPSRKTNFVGEAGPGIDAIVGQRLSHHPPRSIGLPDGKDPTEARMGLDSWVIHKGGEYFFVPSIDALQNYLTGPPDYPDLLSSASALDASTLGSSTPDARL